MPNLEGLEKKTFWDTVEIYLQETVFLNGDRNY